MIPRYSHPEMALIWSDENKYRLWLEVETLALEGMAEEGSAPREAAQAVRERGGFNTTRVLEIEQEVKHDVIAFLTNVAEHVGPESRFVHRGMTSNDLLDTTFALQLRDSGTLIQGGLEKLRSAIKTQAYKFKKTPCIGRSHGIHAEPTTFGLKLASWYAELSRAEERILAAINEVSVAKIAGAVGTYASVSPQVEQYVAEKLSLRPEAVATQVVPRDRHASFFTALALLASSLERVCVEIRHLQRTEVAEVSEPFGKGQKGSSAMPHKKNPILTENLTGLARLVRGYAGTALENVALWHERDISHSSVERVIGPDSCILTDFMLRRLTSVIEGLVVNEARMLENLEATRGLIYSGSLLIVLIDNGVTREDAYRLVQEHALAAWEEGGASFETRVLEEPEICDKVPREEIENVFRLERHHQHVDLIFERVFES